MSPRPAEAAVAALSRRQYGAWSRGQALTAGITRHVIRRRLESGAWLLLDTAVYGDPAVPPTYERSLIAAVLAEPWAVVSHRSAAVLHELHGFRRGRPEITVPPGANARGKLARVHRGVDVASTTIRRIPCVTIAQCFVDLAQVVRDERLRMALSERAAAEPRMLDAVRDRYVALAPRGGRDLRPLRRVLEVFGTGALPSETELERRLRTLVSRPGIPPVAWQAPFPGRVSGPQRVDGLIEAWRVVLEADGRSWHTRLDDFERDRRRDAEAAAAGYLTLRFTWHQLTEEPDWCLAVLRNVGATRAPAA